MASPLPCETTVGHVLDVTRGAAIGPALRRVIAALADMPPGTEVRLTWRTRVSLHAPLETDVAVTVSTRPPRITPLLAPDIDGADSMRTRPRDRLAAKRAAERMHG